jgi:hypothetical protein
MCGIRFAISAILLGFGTAADIASATRPRPGPRCTQAGMSP